MKRKAQDFSPGQLATFPCGCVAECIGFERAEIGGRRDMMYLVVQPCRLFITCNFTGDVRSGVMFVRCWNIGLEFDPLASALHEFQE